MPTLHDLTTARTGLSAPDVEWLHQLVADWQLLADLSFADLVLWLPRRDGSGWVAGAQMRPSTGPTVYIDDLVGTEVDRGQRLQIDTSFDAGRICREQDPEWIGDVPMREETIPVVRAGRVIAVVSRHTNLASARTPSRLEMSYLDVANDLAQMIAEGAFPVPGSTEVLDGPRVGDGLLRLDADGRVLFASPNARSAYRRLGLAADLEGVELGAATAALVPSTGPVHEAVSVVAAGRKARLTEVEGADVSLQLRSIPLTRVGRRIGAVLLVHDVTELRRRERELVTKDATIREIHHRVKNNLQTVSSLLRLQARRVPAGMGRTALAEAGRRVDSIALVHETLSQSLEELADFDGIADRLVAAVRELSPPEARALVRRDGRFGVLPADVATSLAMVLNELLQNALEHGLAGGGGTIEVRVRRGDGRLRVSVVDDGKGLPAGFDLQRSANLGLQIVGHLVNGDLGGILGMRAGSGGGTVAEVVVPVADAEP